MTENAQRNREAEVNLLAAAREAQWSAAAFMGPNTMKLVSPAKVNLLLAIGARREDGYHDADTIMHALALHDTLYLCAEDISADELAKRTSRRGVPRGRCRGRPGGQPCHDHRLGRPHGPRPRCAGGRQPRLQSC